MSHPLVKRYIIALDQHKLKGIFIFGLISGLSGVVAIMPSSPTPVSFQALGILSITTPPKVFSETGSEIQQQGTQITQEMLLAPNVIEATAVAVGTKPQEIAKNAEVKIKGEEDAKGGGGSKGGAAASSIIGVLYKDSDPERAAKTLSVLLEKMVEQSRLINSERLRTIIESIENRSAEAEDELKKAQEELERYNRIEGAALAAAQDGTLLGGISGSQQQQRQIQLNLEGLETQMASLEKRLGLNADEAYTNSALSADPIIASLRGQIQQVETQIKTLSQDLRDQHPTMIELRKQQKTFEALLQERAAEVIGGNGLGEALTPSKIRADSSLDPARKALADQLVALSTQRDTLKQQLEATKRTEQELLKRYQRIPTKQLEQMRLNQKFQIKQSFYSTLQASLIDAKAAEAETVSNLSIAQPPQVSKIGGEDNGMNPVVVLAGGTVGGLVLAAASILLLAILDNKLYSPQEIRQILAQQDVRLFGELPVVTNADPDLGQTGIILQSDSPYLEFYERFRSSLRRGEHKSLKMVLVTSTVEGEGKTVSAYNLAIASAQAGKRTLVIEANLRSPSQAQFLGVTIDPAAKIEPLRYYNSLSECVKLAPNIENLYIIPSPGPVRQAVAILESSELKQLLAEARGRFDFVVIDTPSLSRCDDALSLQPLTEGMILVTRPGYTQKAILNQATQELTEAEPSPLLGAIINGADTSVAVAPPEEIKEEIETEYEDEEVFEENELEEDEEEQIPTGAARF
ncbi:MAG TPA: lipopolysaccharide biosynthesis [Cyanobacteria bacterium UBA11162]|nr:lipopolysaccharide biosynthesis [Cyanobacteria bacterium UBA11162]